MQLKNNYEVEHQEIKKIVGSGNISTAACIATAWTSLVIGFVPSPICFFSGYYCCWAVDQSVLCLTLGTGKAGNAK